jgi:CheY-like chemotaxis protein
VLVVDDNRDAADTMATLLQGLGHHVRVAYDADAALESLATFQPALALIDLGMPGVDGYELARRVRANRAFDGTRLVALTGWGQDGARRRSADAGFDRHLVKPLSVEALNAMLQDFQHAADQSPHGRASTRAAEKGPRKRAVPDATGG